MANGTNRHLGLRSTTKNNLLPILPQKKKKTRKTTRINKSLHTKNTNNTKCQLTEWYMERKGCSLEGELAAASDVTPQVLGVASHRREVRKFGRGGRLVELGDVRVIRGGNPGTHGQRQHRANTDGGPPTTTTTTPVN